MDRISGQAPKPLVSCPILLVGAGALAIALRVFAKFSIQRAILLPAATAMAVKAVDAQSSAHQVWAEDHGDQPHSPRAGAQSVVMSVAWIVACAGVAKGLGSDPVSWGAVGLLLPAVWLHCAATYFVDGHHNALIQAQQAARHQQALDQAIAQARAAATALQTQVERVRPGVEAHDCLEIPFSCDFAFSCGEQLIQRAVSVNPSSITSVHEWNAFARECIETTRILQEHEEALMQVADISDPPTQDEIAKITDDNLRFWVELAIPLDVTPYPNASQKVQQACLEAEAKVREQTRSELTLMQEMHQAMGQPVQSIEVLDASGSIRQGLELQRDRIRKRLAANQLPTRSQTT